MDLTGKTTVFVYGTLMQGFPNEIVISKFPHKVFPAKIDDVELYDVGSFPAMVKGNHSYIGELVVFDDTVDSKAVFENMDRLEGYNPDNLSSSLYTREKVRVIYREVDGDKINLIVDETQAYFWNQSCSRLVYIDPEKYSGYYSYINRSNPFKDLRKIF